MRKLFGRPVTLIILIYVGILLSVIGWGIPNSDRVFTYQMDEWHQFKAIGGLWRKGTNNVWGAANGPSAHFIISGIYLLPFVLTGYINPNLLSSISNLEMQHRIFILLRLNTLIFGAGTIYILYLILKKSFKVNPVIGLILFTFTPSFLILSNYFKYDIALIFWILLALKLILDKRAVLAGLVTGVALATKISALPLVGIYFLAFLQNRQEKHNWRDFYRGIVGLILVFVFLGMPDILMRTADVGLVRNFYISNIINQPKLTANANLGMPWWLYLLTVRFPVNFGYGLYPLTLWALVANWKTNNNRLKLVNFGFILFLVSVLMLKLAAIGNRILVLVPFMAIMAGYYLSGLKKRFAIFLSVLVVMIQAGSGLYYFYPKWQQDPRVTSSKWIKENIEPGTEIGLGGNPIYEMMPDIILKDYYFQDFGVSGQAKYKYIWVSANTTELPKTVIVTNYDQDENIENSPKADLINRLNKESFSEIATFKQREIEINYSPSVISIFEKI